MSPLPHIILLKYLIDCIKHMFLVCAPLKSDQFTLRSVSSQAMGKLAHLSKNNRWARP